MIRRENDERVFRQQVPFPHFFYGLADIIIMPENGRERGADIRIGYLFH